MRFPKIVILIVNWNGKKDTLECLASLNEAAPSPKFATVVIDNGSTDDSVAAIRKQFPGVPIVETKENLGFAGGNNAGIQWALGKSFEWIFLLNNDTIVEPTFMKSLMEATKQKPDGKIFGAKICRYHNPNTIDHLGGAWSPSLAEFVSFGMGKIDDGSLDEMKPVDYVCGCALLMHRLVPETIGLLEEPFFLLWEESDFCTRAKRAGFEIWTAPQAKIWHKVSASFTGGKAHMHYFWWRNRLLYLSRNTFGQEKRAIYRKTILPEMVKCYKLALLKSAQQGVLYLLGRRDAKRQAKARCYRAGALGILHYFLGRFGNCPKRVSIKGACSSSSD